MPISSRLQNHTFTPAFEALCSFFATGTMASSNKEWEGVVLPKQPLSYVTMEGTTALETVALTDLYKAAMRGVGKFRQPILACRLGAAFFKGDTTATRVMPRLLAIKVFDDPDKDKDSAVLVCVPVFEASTGPRSLDVPVVLQRCSKKKAAGLFKTANSKKGDAVFAGPLQLVLPPAAHANVTWDKAYRTFLQGKLKKSASPATDENDSDDDDEDDDDDAHDTVDQVVGKKPVIELDEDEDEDDKVDQVVGKKRAIEVDDDDRKTSGGRHKRAQTNQPSDMNNVPPEPTVVRRAATTTPGITAAIRAMIDAIEHQAPLGGMQIQLLITQKWLSEADLCAMTRQELHEAGFPYGLASLVLRCRANHLPTV